MVPPGVRSETCPIESDGPDGPLVIEPEVSRALVAVILSLFGGVATLIAGIVFASTFNLKNWSTTICPGIFLCFSLLVDAFAFYLILKCFNPQPVIALSQRDVYPGSEFEISWMFRGRVQSIHKLTITLVGKEKVSYRQGTSTRTEESVFHRMKLVETEDPVQIAKGFELVELPANTMHSFKSTNNEILWLVQVNGVVAWWPDLDDAFPIRVLTPPAVENADA
jgi:hypothetical protein